MTDMSELNKNAILDCLGIILSRRLETVYVADGSMPVESGAYWESVPCMMVVLSGERDISFPFHKQRKTVLLKPGMAVYCRPESWFLPGMKKGCHYMGLRFGSNYVRLHTSKHPAPPGKAMDKWFHTAQPINPNGTSILNVIHEAAAKPEPDRATLRGLCEAAVAILREQAKHDDGKKKSRRQVMHDAILHYLYENFHLDIDRNSVAEAFKLSPGSLSRIFAVCGQAGFNQQLNRIRLEHATRLTGDPSLQISEIAYRCGYARTSYFIRLFRQQYGMTPGEYRARN
jgi:AraC-like DNA-binding protein